MTDNAQVVALPLPASPTFIPSQHDPFYDAPEWAKELYVQNAEILETHRKILLVVEEIKPEVMSVVNSLQSNPMFKMFLGGKK